jgi:hypothetical protein
MSSPARERFRDASDPQAVLTESAVDPNAAPVYDAKNHSLVLFDRGDEIVVQAGPEGIRFLLVSGKPLEEPVAWYGPIVMNTQAELRQAMSELQTGELVARDTVPPPDHKVAKVLAGDETLRTKVEVMEVDRFAVGHAKAPVGGERFLID